MCGVVLPVCALRARASRRERRGGADNIYDTIQKRSDTSCKTRGMVRVKATKMEGTDREYTIQEREVTRKMKHIAMLVEEEKRRTMQLEQTWSMKKYIML